MESFEGRIRIAVPGDAEAIAGLVKRCYGDTHPVPGSHDPEQLRRAMTAGRLTYVLAFTSGGELAGQVALDAGDAPGFFELGRAIVGDEHRASGVFTLLGLEALRVAPGVGARVVIGRVVTSHVHAQKFGRAGGLTTVGLLLGMFPASVRPSGIRPSRQPISAVIHARCLETRPAPRHVALEGRDRELALLVLDRLGVRAGARPRAMPPLGVQAVRDAHFSVLQLRFGAGRPGGVDASTFASLEESTERLLWADLPADHRETVAIAARLRDLGFGFAAYIPGAGARGEDVLRLQRCRDPRPIDPALIHVLDDAAPFKDAVLADTPVEALS